MSDIFGDGYGSDHNWKTHYTNQSPKGYSDKFTVYACVDCGVSFTHHYDVTPNIFVAMKKHHVPENCPSKGVNNE